jgi:hypothetical protein
MTNAKKNPLRLDAETEHTTGHFYLSSVAEWRTGRDLPKLITAMRRSGFPFMVYWVPVSEADQYRIENYAPQVPGAVQIATYGLDFQDRHYS